MSASTKSYVAEGFLLVFFPGGLVSAINTRLKDSFCLGSTVRLHNDCLQSKMRLTCRVDTRLGVQTLMEACGHRPGKLRRCDPVPLARKHVALSLFTGLQPLCIRLRQTPVAGWPSIQCKHQARPKLCASKSTSLAEDIDDTSTIKCT